MPVSRSTANRPRQPDLLVEVAHLDDDGNGMAPWGDNWVQVPASTVGDRAAVRITGRSRHRNVFWCEVVTWHHRGPDFRHPVCAHAEAGLCDGCPWMHLDPVAAAESKRGRVARLLGRSPEEIELFTGSDALHWRNRSWFVATVMAGKVRLGSYRRGSHEVAPMTGCHVVRPAIAEVHAALESLLAAQRVRVSRTSEEAGLRYVQIRTGDDDGVLVELVFTDDASINTELLEATNALPRVSSVWVSTNRDPGNRLRGDAPRHVAGDRTLPVTVNGTVWQVGPETFFQLNGQVVSELAARVGAWCAGHDVIWDLYAGVGVMSDAALRAGARVFAADVVKESEALARSNERLSYATIDLSHEGVPQPWPNPDLVVVNPPRRGLDARVVETLLQRQPEHVVYVSCNPETLARDLNLLVGWSVEQVVAFDMMPQTPHVEVAVRLRREGSNVGQ